MIHISGSRELASSYQRIRIKLSAGNDSLEGISLWYNFDIQRTWGWFLLFLHFQTVHQRRVVPELATFLTVHADHAVDSDVEANPKKKEIGDSK
jgi:hypothetical protein